VATVAVQQTLRLAGFWDGPVDGEWTPALTEALMAFQTELGVTPTGTVDAATVAALEKAIAKAGKPEPASPSPTASDTGPSPSGTGSADATTSTSG
jgi:peptidoglycan hydrolase-like protein with peptidoglycan-binding domain